jgi:hypothetical protein
MTPSLQKEFQHTRDGSPFRIYATDGQAPFVLHGAVFVGGGWTLMEWTERGFVHEDETTLSEFDLVHWVKETPRCERCRGTGIVNGPDVEDVWRWGSTYCSCSLGRDLQRVESRYGAIEGLVN